MFLKYGICKGTSQKAKNNGEIIEHYVLIVSEGRDEFGQTVDVTTGIRLSKRQMEAGVNRMYDQLKDKHVAVPFFVKQWKAKSGATGLEYWLDGEGRPVNLQPKPVQNAENARPAVA